MEHLGTDCFLESFRWKEVSDTEGFHCNKTHLKSVTKDGYYVPMKTFDVWTLRANFYENDGYFLPEKMATSPYSMGQSGHFARVGKNKNLRNIFQGIVDLLISFISFLHQISYILNVI